MTMHLAPGLTTTGKKKGKMKFRNAEAAKRYRELEQEWSELQKKWKVDAEDKKKKRGLTAQVYKPEPTSYRGSATPRLPSSDKTWDPCVKNPDKVYTGNAIIGIGTMHKSNAIPIFSDDQAKDISKMRR